MKKQIAKAEYLISDNYSGVEITVRLKIDYEAKTFRVKSMRKDGSFVFTDNLQSPDRVISIGNAIRNAAEFAKLELGLSDIENAEHTTNPEETFSAKLLDVFNMFMEAHVAERNRFNIKYIPKQ